MLILGAGFVWWPFRTPTNDGLSPGEPTGYQSRVMWLWFRNSANLKAPAAATWFPGHPPQQTQIP